MARNPDMAIANDSLHRMVKPNHRHTAGLKDTQR